MSATTSHAAVSRRAFLRLAALAGGSALLAACQQAPAPALSLSVPLVVEARAAGTWEEAH